MATIENTNQPTKINSFFTIFGIIMVTITNHFTKNFTRNWDLVIVNNPINFKHNNANDLGFKKFSNLHFCISMTSWVVDLKSKML